MLRITALVKYVPELTDRRFAADFTLDRDAAPGRLSELDEHTAEQAISLAEARRAEGGEAELTYLTMGPPGAADALRKALSMGGDRAVHVLDPALHGSDVHATSRALAAAIKRVGFDLVVCGMASTDAGLGLGPPCSLTDFGLVREKIANMATLIYVGESLVYRTVGMMDGALPKSTKPAPTRRKSRARRSRNTQWSARS